MSHEQARLSANDPVLGVAGTLVTISDVEAAYPTSMSAKGAARFQCADPRCKVTVRAVIPEKDKPGRKRSPSAYFTSSPATHATGCTRRPLEQGTPPTPTTLTMAARSMRGSIPSVWNDSLTGASRVAGADGGIVVPPNPATPSRGAKVTRPGSGQSKMQTGRVKILAEVWLERTRARCLAAPFAADWNPGGNYETAFEVVTPRSVETSPSPERIYVGEISRLWKGNSGHGLTLAARHREGHEITVWLKSSLGEAGSDAKGLAKELRLREVKPGMIVFAFGAFVLQHVLGRTFYSLAIDKLPHVWVVSAEDAQKACQLIKRTRVEAKSAPNT